MRSVLAPILIFGAGGGLAYYLLARRRRPIALPFESAASKTGKSDRRLRAIEGARGAIDAIFDAWRG